MKFAGRLFYIVIHSTDRQDNHNVSRMNTETILIADPDDDSRKVITDFLKKEGYGIIDARDGETALSIAKKQSVDVLITDLKLPRLDGIALLKKIKTDSPELAVLVVTGNASVSTAVKAMKLGADDFLTKPVNTEELKYLLQAILVKQAVHRRSPAAKEEAAGFENIIGTSDVMQKVFQLIDKIAAVDSTLIIYGESGTGKELVSRAIHARSRRAKNPLIPVNCGAIPEELLESELFGHEKGSFTSAYRMRVGRFELANGGTIFLDEIGDMSPNLQVKILRVLQEHEFERVGGVKPIKADIRVIAATHRDLEKAVAGGTFREDLYYRLNVIPIELPPLRERTTDIPLLVQHFIKQFNREKGKAIQSISDRAMQCLMQYNWPGNVRELQNITERLVILNDAGTIDVSDLPDKILQGRQQAGPAPVAAPVDRDASFTTMVTTYERQLILNALEQSNGVKNKAAKLLNMNRTTLVEKMKKLEITYKG